MTSDGKERKGKCLSAEGGQRVRGGRGGRAASVEGRGGTTASVEGRGDRAASVEGRGDRAASVEGRGYRAASLVATQSSLEKGLGPLGSEGPGP